MKPKVGDVRYHISKGPFCKKGTATSDLLIISTTIKEVNDNNVYCETVEHWEDEPLTHRHKIKASYWNHWQPNTIQDAIEDRAGWIRAAYKNEHYKREILDKMSRNLRKLIDLHT